MRTIKKQIREYIDFSAVCSIREAGEKFDTYLTHIKNSFKTMRASTEWNLDEATYIYEYAIRILTERYVDALLSLDRFRRRNYQFFI